MRGRLLIAIALLLASDCNASVRHKNLNTTILKDVSNSTSEPAEETTCEELEQLLHSHKVVLFSKTYCPFSKGLKKILAAYHITDMHVEEVDLREDPQKLQDELQKHSHIHTVPQLFLNGHFVGNYDAIHEMDTKNKVRPMLEQAGAITKSTRDGPIMEGRLRLNLELDKIRPVLPQISDVLQTTPGELQFGPGQTYRVTTNDIDEKAVIGQGNYGGVVSRAIHRETGCVMAVKRIRANGITPEERKKMLRELQIIIQGQKCEDIVRFYGALFQDGDCWICMELLDCSLDKFYRDVYARSERLPEPVVGFIAASVLRALSFLKEKHKIIHRDVKPSNMLLDRKGFLKLCDFGISGYLVDSIADTQDPERLSDKIYGTRSDIWSLGISLVEVCQGKFPFEWKTVFDQLQALVQGDPPFMTADFYSMRLCDFVNQCLIKDSHSRPDFNELSKHPFFLEHSPKDPAQMTDRRREFGEYVCRFVESQLPSSSASDAGTPTVA